VMVRDEFSFSLTEIKNEGRQIICFRHLCCC
jgi:hypothetical protein